jgi:hypothetical protein
MRSHARSIPLIGSPDMQAWKGESQRL